MLQILVIPALTDNYVYLLHDAETETTACIDPSEAAPVTQRLHAIGWSLTHILNTHHHWDHTGGNSALIAEYAPEVIGAACDVARIPGLTRGVGGGEVFKLGAADVHVFFIPGHTSGHVAYWLPDPGILFSGDTLFSFGCGRLFEGTAQQMWQSLVALRELPEDTLVYCGHEYTEANIRFALTIDPENATLHEHAKTARARRAKGSPTVPSRIGIERAGNPFLRADDPALKQRLGMAQAADHSVLAEIRRRKDEFR